MIILADNDVIGAVAILRQILERGDPEFLAPIAARFVDFAALGLRADSPDLLVWQAAQSVEAVLITGNRKGGADSLDRAIRDHSDATSITIGDSKRTICDFPYAELCAFALLNYLERIDSLRGTGRLYIP